MEPAMAELGDGDPFIEGIDAFERNVTFDACPYSKGSDEYELWLLGWYEGKRVEDWLRQLQSI